MNPQEVQLVCLHHPPTGGSSTGKVYIGVSDPRAAFTVYGPNRPSAGGTIKEQVGPGAVDRVLRDKERKGYSPVTIPAMPQAMIETVIGELRRRIPTLNPGTPAIAGDRLIFGSSAAPQPGPAPRRRRQENIRVWI